MILSFRINIERDIIPMKIELLDKYLKKIYLHIELVKLDILMRLRIV